MAGDAVPLGSTRTCLGSRAMPRRTWRTNAIIAAALCVLAACSEDSVEGLSRAGVAADIKPDGNAVGVTRVSPPAADRLSVVVVVENAGEDTVDAGMVVGDVLDGAGAPVTQGNGPVLAPRRIPPGEVGFARVVFPVALPDPFTVEWSVIDGNAESGRFDLPLTRFEVANDTLQADVENDRDETVVVVEVRVLCLDASGNALDVVIVPGPTTRVPKDGSVTIGGPLVPGCAGALGGAVGRNA